MNTCEYQFDIPRALLTPIADAADKKTCRYFGRVQGESACMNCTYNYHPFGSEIAACSIKFYGLDHVSATKQVLKAARRMNVKK